MRLTPALEFEKLRKDPESWNKIFLHKDGKFFRAYEWSAWLIKTVVCTEDMQKERGDQKMLTANRYVTKKGEYASVGFPLESMAKFMVGFDNFDPNTVEDYAEFTLTTFDTETSSYEEIEAQFEAWKQSLPEKIRNMRIHDGDAVIRSVNSFLGVLSHHKTYRIRRAMFLREKFLKIGTFDNDMKTFQ